MSATEHDEKTLSDFEAYEREVATLRAQLEAVTRDLEVAHIYAADREGLALQLDAARETIQYGIELRQKAERERDEARESEARMRTALEGLVEYERKRHPPRMGGDEYSSSLREPMAAARAALSAPAPEPEGPDYSGLCSAPECGGHCGYAHARGCEAIREYLAEHGGEPHDAAAEAFDAALTALAQVQKQLVAVTAERDELRAALSAPAPEVTRG